MLRVNATDVCYKYEQAIGEPTSHKDRSRSSTWKLPSEAQMNCNMCNLN